MHDERASLGDQESDVVVELPRQALGPLPGGRIRVPSSATAPALAQRRASRRAPAPHLQRQRPEDVEAQRLREEIRELLRARDLLQRPIWVLDEPLMERAKRNFLVPM